MGIGDLPALKGRTHAESRQQSVRKVDARLPGKWNSNCHGARPVHRIISVTRWFRTNRLSIKKSLSQGLRTHWELRRRRDADDGGCGSDVGQHIFLNVQGAVLALVVRQ